MANKEIKTVMKIEGEDKYNSAIKQANATLRSLKSELKAETAELGKNASEQEKNAKKTESLKKQIAEQEKIVATLKEALEKSKAQFGEHAEVTEKWATKLNNARTTLANMKNDMDGAATSIQKVSDSTNSGTVATKALADSFKDVGTFAGTVSDTIESIFTSVVNNIKEIVMEVWDIIAETAAKADDWSDTAGYWGTSAQEVQKYAYAVGSANDSFDDLLSAVSRISLGGKEDKIQEMLNIDRGNLSDWEYALAVMGRLNEYQRQGQNLDDIYSTIFGERKGTKVMDLVNDWESILGYLDEFDGNKGGLGMTDAELQTMQDLQLEIAHVENQWEALKSKVAAGLGKVTLELATDTSGMIDAVADYFNAESDNEKTAALEAMKVKMEEFFTDLGNLIREAATLIGEVGADLSESDDKFVATIGSLFTGVSDVLNWFTEGGNIEKVKGAMETIANVWLVGKGFQALNNVTSLFTNLQNILGLGSSTEALGLAGLTGGTLAWTLTLAAATITIANAVLNTDWKKIQEDYEKGQETLDEVAEAKGYDNKWDMYWGDKAKGENVDTRTGIRAICAEIFGTRGASDTILYGDTAQETEETRHAIETTADSLQEMLSLLYRRERGGGGWWTSLFNDETGMSAAQAWWDAYRADTMGDSWKDEYEAMAQAYGGENSALFVRLDKALSLLTETGYAGADLPAWLFDPSLINWNAEGGPQVMNDLGAAVRQMPGEVGRAVGGLRIVMDGATVARIVTPYVSQYLVQTVE